MADKVNQFTLSLENNIFCQGLKLLKLGGDLFLPNIKYLSDILIMILRMIELKKNVCVLKNTRVGITLF